MVKLAANSSPDTLRGSLMVEDSTVSSATSDGENIEEAVSFKELAIMLRMSGIAVYGRDNKLLNIFIGVMMWLLFAAMFTYFVIRSATSKSVVWSNLAELTWCLHSCLVYTIISRRALHSPGSLFNIIWATSAQETDSWRLDILGQRRGLDVEEVRKVVRRYSCLCIAVSVLNTLGASLSYFSNFLYRFLPLWDNPVWNVFGMIIWYFYSCHWFSAMVLIFLATHFFRHRLHVFCTHCEQLDGSSLQVLQRTMEWYDDLYAINKLIQSSIGELTACTIGALSLLVVFFLEGLLTREHHHSTASVLVTLFWIVANLCVIIYVSSTVAMVETYNTRIRIAFASIKSSIQMDDIHSMSRYQFILNKLSSIPFGVYIHRTKRLITFDLLLNVISILGSVFLFFLGTNHL